jgi:hypothetical protein
MHSLKLCPLVLLLVMALVLMQDQAALAPLLLRMWLLVLAPAGSRRGPAVAQQQQQQRQAPWLPWVSRARCMCSTREPWRQLQQQHLSKLLGHPVPHCILVDCDLGC